jgi:uncharacterized protein (DUF1330 family)
MGLSMISLRSRILHRTLKCITGVLALNLSVQKQLALLDEVSRVTDPVGYEENNILAPADVKLCGGKQLVRGCPNETLEGDWCFQRLVILEFESVERIKAWLNSVEYAPGAFTLPYICKKQDGHRE